jgi:hypothetical protein
MAGDITSSCVLFAVVPSVRTMYISSIYNHTRKSIQCSPDENPRALATSQFNTFQKHKRHEHTRTHAHEMHKTSLQRTLFAVFAFIALALPVDAAVYYGIMNSANVQSFCC